MSLKHKVIPLATFTDMSSKTSLPPDLPHYFQILGIRFLTCPPSLLTKLYKDNSK